MAVFKCPDCKNTVSTEAEACPKCGRKVTQADIQTGSKKKPGKAVYIVAVIVALGILGALGSSKSKIQDQAQPQTQTQTSSTTSTSTPQQVETEEFLKGFKLLGEDKVDEAFQMFMRGAEKNDPVCIAWVGMCYTGGWGTKKDIKKGLEMIKKGADAGSIRGMAEMGRIYVYGSFGVPKNTERGKEYLKKAMELESPTAFFVMGLAYEDGAFGEKNFDKAIEMYEKSANLGNTYATQMARRLKEQPDLNGTVQALLNEYKKNEVGADKKLKGKTIRLEGRVGDVKKDAMNNLYVTFAASDQWQIRSVQCFFGEEYEDALANLEPNEKIVIQGTVDGLFGNVILKDCWIVE